MPSLDTALSHHRLMRAPLDDKEVFTNLPEIMDYCQNGARYDGQRITMVASTFPAIEYTIRNNIPIINMKGSEPIFKKITFDGDSTESHGMLIYENNLYEYSKPWEYTDVFTFDEGKLCIISQLEIFRLLDAVGNRTFKFYLERQQRGTDNVFFTSWNQSYDPYMEWIVNRIDNSNSNPGAIINKMSYDITTGATSFLKTNNSDIILMPNNNSDIFKESSYITRIYVKAEDYYNAWVNS